jgi:polyhydroxyalkanoate synthesis repressor PhaR
MLKKPDTKPKTSDVVIIKKYANRRLYNTETSSYVTLDDIAQMVRADREFQVFDAKSGDDLTHAVLTQIIVEQESRTGGPALLPIPFLRQLIRFYDDSLARMVPSYLQMSLDTLMQEQDRFRSQFGSTWAGHAFETYQDQARRNLVLFEQAMKMWTPFGPLPVHSSDPYHATNTADPLLAAEAITLIPYAADLADQPNSKTGGGREQARSQALTTVPPEKKDDLAEMRTQLAAMQEQIEVLARQRPKGS